MPFDINKNDEILIFGNNIRAKFLQENLKTNGFHNFSIVDTSVKEDDYSSRKNHSIYFIAFQNARKHDKFASQLYKKGLRKILFLPTNGSMDFEQVNILRRLYNDFLYGKFEYKITVPFYDELFTQSINTQNGIAQAKNGMITYYARLETIFINDICTRKDVIAGKRYYGQSLVLANHYRSMFEKVSGCADVNEKDYKEYCAAQGYHTLDPEALEEQILDRYELYCLFKKEFNQGMDFFESSASLCKANGNGGLHIKEGLHRAVFLMMQKLSYIPVMVSKEEFERLYPEEKIQKIREFFDIHQIYKTVTPISHPAFYNFPAEKEILEPSILTRIKHFFGIRGLDGKQILEFSDYNSYFSRNVGRMLWNKTNSVVESQETDKLRYQLAVLYNDLLNIQNVRVIYHPNLIIEKYYDIIFLMGKVRFDESNIEILSMINEYVFHTMIYECNLEDSHAQINFIFSNSGFVTYTNLCQYFDGIHTRVVLIFQKDNGR